MSDTHTAPSRPAHDLPTQRWAAGRPGKRRDMLLSAVAHAAEVLTATPDLRQALVEASQVLGEATGVDRVNVVRYDHGAQAGFLYAEWAGAGVAPLSQVDPGPYGYAEYAEVWRPLLAGDVYHSPLPEKTGANAALNVATNTKTDLFVPVFVAGRFWGALGFDDCTTERAWTDGELGVLRTAAAAVAAAVRREGLERERTHAAEERAAELARRNALLATAADASRALIDAVDLGAACDRVLAMLGPALDADRAALGVLTPSADGGAPWCELTHEWTAPGVPRQTDDPALRRTRLAGSAAQVAAFLAGEAFQTTFDTLDAPQRREQVAAGAQAGFALPVFVDGRAWGVLGFDDCRRARVWDAEEIGLVRVVTTALAAAMQRERAEHARVESVARERERAAEERAAEAEHLSRLLRGVVAASRVLVDEPDFETGLRRWCGRLGAAVTAQRAGVAVFAPDPSHTLPRAIMQLEWAAAAAAPLDGTPVPRTADFDEWAARLLAGEAIWAVHAELVDPASRAYWDATGCRANLIVPVRVDRCVWGYVYFDIAEDRPYRAADLAVLQTAADGLAAAVKREEALRATAAEREARERGERAHLAALARVRERAAEERAAALGRSNAVLSARQRLLEAAVDTSDALLAAVDVEEAIGGVLARLGAVLDADRALLIRFDPPTADAALGWAVVQHEWTVPGVARQSADPALARMNLDQYASLVGQLRAERVVQFATHDLPSDARAEQEATGAVSQVVITVLVDGEVWGFLGFDDCRRPRAWDAGEVGLLQVVAAALGSAIKRERLVRDRVAVERAGAEERTRIARELHDTLAQGLAGIVMQLGAARAKLGAAGAAGAAQLDRVEGLARESLAVARRSITVLRPHAPESGEGLGAALDAAAAAARAACPAVVALGVTGAPRRAPPEVEFELLRVAQAALANAAQHAYAARIAVTLDFGAGDAPALRIVVADDGRGFDPAAPRPGRFGLVGMSERAARVGAALTLVTAPGEGTEVVVVWPGGSCDAGRAAVPTASERRAPASGDASVGVRTDAPT